MENVSHVSLTALRTAFKWLGRWQSITACLLICTTLSCQQNEQKMVLESSPQLSTEDGVLKFSSSDSYEKLLQNPKLLDNLLVKEDFESFEKANKSARTANEVGRKLNDKKDKEVPETLARLLNKDGVCQIGQWVIKLNFQTEKVYVLKDDDKKNLYNELIAEHIGDKIWKFTFDDEVLDLLYYGYKGSSPSKSQPGGRPAIFCGGGISGSPDPLAQSGFYRCSPTTAKASVSNHIQYGKFGIYFECDLSWGGAAYIDSEGPTLGGCENVGTIDRKYFFETNCNNSWTGSEDVSGVQYNLPLQSDGTGVNYTFNGRHRIYQGSRGLRCLRIEKFDIRVNTSSGTLYIHNELIRGC